MNNKITILMAFAIGLIVGAFSLHFVNAARLPKAVASEWPPELDAVVAAPQNHKIILENDKVRVLDVTVKPGTREPVHTHSLPSVLVVLEGGQARDYDGKGRFIDEGKVIPDGTTAPFAFWLDRSPPHSVENLDSIPIHLIRVELKATAANDQR